MKDASRQPVLTLHALQVFGKNVRHAWTWQPGDLSVGFDHLLEALVGDEDLRKPWQDCLVKRSGSQDQPLWVLVNTSARWVCMVNRQMLGRGQQLRLSDGDLLEVGFSRWQVQLSGKPERRELSANDAGSSLPAEAAPMADGQDDVAMASFALTDLANVAAPGQTQDSRRILAPLSDFSDLVVDAQLDNGTSNPQRPENDAALNAATSAYAPPGNDDAAASGDDLLRHLHEKYIDKLVNPFQAEDDGQWQVRTHTSSMQRENEFENLLQEGKQKELDELLGRSAHIDHVMASFDDLVVQDILAPDPHASVLLLFAPEHLRPVEAQESLESLVVRSLPRLTRSEHHGVFVDSAMPIYLGPHPAKPNPPS